MQAFGQARKLDPDIAELHMLSGKAYLHVGLYDQAIESFKDGIVTDRGHAQAYYGLGKAYLRIGDHALALKQQKALEELDPKLASDLLELINNK